MENKLEKLINDLEEGAWAGDDVPFVCPIVLNVYIEGNSFMDYSVFDSTLNQYSFNQLSVSDTVKYIAMINPNNNSLDNHLHYGAVEIINNCNLMYAEMIHGILEYLPEDRIVSILNKCYDRKLGYSSYNLNPNPITIWSS